MSKKLINEIHGSYYKPHNQKYLDKLVIQAYTKQKTLSNHDKKYTELLKHKFKKLVLARNALARENGYPNYFDYVSDWDEVPKKKLDIFFNNVDAISKKILNDASKILNRSKRFEDNLVSFDFSQYAKKNFYNFPKDVIDSLSKYDDVNANHLNSIKITSSQIRLSFPEYAPQKSNIVIRHSNIDNSLSEATTLAHEYGHALGMLEALESDPQPTQPKPYIDELRAIKTERKFVETLTVLDQKIANLEILYFFLNTLFESQIYKNPDQDFEKAYANAHNIVTVGRAKQKTNWAYILDTFFVEYPCYSTNYSVIYSDLLKN